MTPFRLSSEAELRAYLIDTLRDWMNAVSSGAPLHVPTAPEATPPVPGMWHHSEPELFLQISGETRFSFPGEVRQVRPMEACIVPRGTPHAERVRALEEPFLNIVIRQCHEVTIHLAREIAPGSPGGFIALRLRGVSPGFSVLLDEATNLTLAKGPTAEAGARGVLRGALALLLVSLEGEGTPGEIEPFKVIRARQIIEEHYHDATFSIAKLAAQLQCNVDYLSQLFRKTTGSTLQSTLADQRLQRAVALLHNTTLNVSEISAAVGFRDPSYFTRAFRQWAGITPRETRRLHAYGRRAGTPRTSAFAPPS